MKPTSIRARMTLVLALTIAFFLAVLCTSYLFFVHRSQEKGFAASLDRMAALSVDLAKRMADAKALNQEIRNHNAQVVRSGAIAENIEAWLLNDRGELVQHLGFDGPVRPSPAPPPPAPELVPVLPPVPPLDRPQDWRTRTIDWQGQKLILALPWYHAQREWNSLALALASLSALTTGVAALGAHTLVGRTLRPIEELAQQAESTVENSGFLLRRLNEDGAGNLRPTSTDREIQHLVATLNSMLSRVQEAALSKERFHASASHELRTPLQALAGHLGVALSRDRNNAEYKDVLEEAARQTARLSKLTTDLLLLNRLQTAERLPLPEKVDVAEMCDIALQRAERILASRQLRLLTHWEPLQILGSASYVEILLGNLVENAAKYTPHNSEIGIEISAENRAVLVWNDCSEMDFAKLQEDLHHWTEPFYRRDEARTGSTDGNGLGLAICHAIAVSCGWQMKFSAEDKRVKIQVTWD